VSRRPWIPAFLGSLLLTLLIYHPCLGFGLVADDREMILQPAVQAPDWLAPWRGGLNGTWRPLRVTSYQLDAALFGALNLAGYHATNLFLHAVCGTLVFLLGRRHLKGAWPAGLAAAFFLAHPLQVESVAWITGRKEVLSGALALLGILLFDAAHAGPKPWHRAAATLSLLAACLAREGAVAAVAVVAAEGWLLGGDEARRRLPGRLAGLALGAGGFVITYLSLTGYAASVWSLWARGPLGRWAMLPVWGRIPRLLAFPFGLRSHVEDLVLPSRIQPLGMAWGVLSPALLVLAGWIALRRGARLPGWLLLSAVLAYLPASNLLVTLRVPFAEHYLYLSLAFVSLGIGMLCTRVSRRASLGGGALALALCLALSAARLPVWRDDLGFWRTACRQDPRTGRLEQNLAAAYANAGQPGLALRHSARVYPRLLRIEQLWADFSVGRLHLRQGDARAAAASFRRAAAVARELGRIEEARLLEDLAGE
jgi:hypothetical protein